MASDAQSGDPVANFLAQQGLDPVPARFAAHPEWPFSESTPGELVKPTEPAMWEAPQTGLQPNPELPETRLPAAPEPMENILSSSTMAGGQRDFEPGIALEGSELEPVDAGGDQSGEGTSELVDIVREILEIMRDATRGGEVGSSPPGPPISSPSSQQASSFDFHVRDPRQSEYFPAASPSVQTSTLAGLKGAGGYGFGSIRPTPGYQGEDVPSMKNSRAAETRFAGVESGPQAE